MIGVYKLEASHYEALRSAPGNALTVSGKIRADVRSAFETAHARALEDFSAADAVRAPGLPRGVCERCGEEAAEVKISATTLDGEVLDFSVACRGCARDAGFEIGGAK